MFNKLLKRCMPWMDKGRWVQIRVVGTEPSNISAIYNDNNIVSAVIHGTGSNQSMTVVFKHVPHIIDFKCCPDAGFEDQVLPSLSITYVTDNSIDVPVACPGTYWFYMR